jgi:hypothetical protein
MKIELGNANKTSRLDKQFSISIILTLAIFMAGGSTATHAFAATRPSVAVQLPVYESQIFQERSGS